MIIVCEPQCKSFSHEKVNSGFLYMLSLAYPEDKIRFYAHQTHINSIISILNHDKVEINNIEYIPIKFVTSFSKLGMLYYSFLFSIIFKKASQSNVEKILFLSITAPMLNVIKELKRKAVFSKLKFSFVLHGDFENIADDKAPLKSEPEILKRHTFLEKIKRIKILEVPKKIIARVNIYFDRYLGNKRRRFGEKFPIKKSLLLEHNNDYKYISLSPHIINNASKYIDVNKLNIKSVFFPTVYSEIGNKPVNKFAKFAVFGYGNPSMLQEILIGLTKRKVATKYEIRLISMDIRGMEGFEMITCPSKGKPLTREQMEYYAKDIDFFLILYNEKTYRLSCSGTIIEAFSYSKPIIHFKNDCIDYFNTSNNPVGISCNNVDEFVSKIEYIANNYDSFLINIDQFRNNILKQRAKYSIENSVQDLKKLFD